MNDVRFEEEGALHAKSQEMYSSGNMPGVAKLLINLGIVKTEKQAFYAMIIIVVIILFFAFYLIRNNMQGSDVNDFVLDKYGNTYSGEEYRNLLLQGKDPLSPNFRP